MQKVECGVRGHGFDFIPEGTEARTPKSSMFLVLLADLREWADLSVRHPSFVESIHRRYHPSHDFRKVVPGLFANVLYEGLTLEGSDGKLVVHSPSLSIIVSSVRSSTVYCTSEVVSELMVPPPIFTIQ